MFSRLKVTIERALGFQARREQRARGVLLRMCFGDEAVVKRLIAEECSRTPGVSEAEACRRAIRRLRHDNR